MIITKGELPNEEGDPYSLFLFPMRSPKTKEKCVGRLRMFFEDIGIPGESMNKRCKIFCERAKDDTEWAFRIIIQYLQKQKERVEIKEITAGTLKNRFQVIKLCCDMNNIEIPWKKISRGLPRARKFADDRSPTPEEIRSITDYPDRRIRPIVFASCSSGIRVGAWDYLQWRHITPKERKGEIVAGKLIVYAGQDDQYFTFISPEAYFELQKWKEYRKQSGEQLTDYSWIMRQIWNTKKGYARGLATFPKKLSSEGVKRLVEDALWTQGIRKKLEPGRKRHEFQTDHGFRKFHETRCLLAGMKLINVKILQGQSVGISDSYYRPTEDELLEDYLNAIPFLTISHESQLRLENHEINEENAQNTATAKNELIALRRDLDSLLVLKKVLEEQGVLKVF